MSYCNPVSKSLKCSLVMLVHSGKHWSFTIRALKLWDAYSFFGLLFCGLRPCRMPVGFLSEQNQPDGWYILYLFWCRFCIKWVLITFSKECAYDCHNICSVIVYGFWFVSYYEVRNQESIFSGFVQIILLIWIYKHKHIVVTWHFTKYTHLTRDKYRISFPIFPNLKMFSL